jgi:integrase
MILFFSAARQLGACLNREGGFTMTTKLTDAVLRNLAAGRSITDRGSGLSARRQSEGGAISFFINYRLHGRQRCLSIGVWPKLSITAARKAAKLRFGEIAAGADPAGERRSIRAELNVVQLAAAYFSACRSGDYQRGTKAKKESTLKGDELRIRLYVAGWPLGNTKASLVTTPMVQDHINKVRTTIGEGTSTRLLATLGAIFRYGVAREIVGASPCQNVSAPAYKTKDRHLSPAEFKQLWEYLHRADLNPVMAAALRFIMHTGARRSEAANLKWSSIDANGVCTLPDSKTGRSVRWLSPAALAAAESVRDRSVLGYVFPCSGERLAIMLGAAGLPGVTPHTLRHSYATQAAEALGNNVFLAGKLLGHAPPAGTSVTAGYVHMDHAVLLRCARLVSERIEILCATGAKPEAETVSNVVQIKMMVAG